MSNTLAIRKCAIAPFLVRFNLISNRVVLRPPLLDTQEDDLLSGWQAGDHLLEGLSTPTRRYNWDIKKGLRIWVSWKYPVGYHQVSKAYPAGQDSTLSPMAS